jgi:hypothetical protein
MRARKLDAGASVPPAEVAEAWAQTADDDVIARETSGNGGEDGAPEIARLCIACGAEGCRDHGEMARLDAPSRTLREAIERLRRVAAEHRAAARALRVLVLTEVARGRGDLETKPAPVIEPCPRCTIRDAEAASPPRNTTRKAKRESGQQALPFKAS